MIKNKGDLSPKNAAIETEIVRDIFVLVFFLYSVRPPPLLLFPSRSAMEEDSDTDTVLGPTRETRLPVRQRITALSLAKAARISAR